VTRIPPMASSLTQIDFQSWKEFLQNPNNLRELFTRSYEFKLLDQTFALVPFTSLDSRSEKTVELLSEWREKHLYAYPTRSKISHEGTKLWFQNSVLDNPQRVLFWIMDSGLNRLGHIGVVFQPDQDLLEIDNVLRGVNKYPRLMSEALRVIESIVEFEFSMSSVTLRVLESNDHARRFYLKNGYTVTDKVELKWVDNATGSILMPGSPAEDSFLSMAKTLQPSKTEVPNPILTAGPSITPREITYVTDAVSRGWNLNHSDYLNRFEKEFAEYVGVKHAMATSSCTGALHLALLSLGIGPGDEVLVPEITWVASASAIHYVGATPIFVDIDPITWTIDPIEIKKKITSRTKAIIPVHLYGFAAAMNQIIEIAHNHNIFVVEDAAPAIGTLFGDQPVGTFGDFGCYSFQGAKLLVTGEGGMLVTDNDKLFAKARKIQDHGRKPGTFWIEEIGYKYKMNNITAALGLAQLERANNQIGRKRRINAWYREGLKDLNCIDFQEEALDTKSICWMTSISLNSESRISRDDLMNLLKQKGIDTRPVFPAISQYPIWAYAPETQPIAKRIGETSINLPSGVALNQNTVHYVIDSIRELL
jgi:perosamine synthetase